MSTMNFAELIKPFTYTLDCSMRHESDVFNEMTEYDIVHLDSCKDMLELIMRALAYKTHMRDFADEIIHDVDQIEKYTKFINKLTAHIRFNAVYTTYSDKTDLQKYSDFRKFMPFRMGEYACLNGHTWKYCIVDKNTCIIAEINEWQAYYITIYNMIIDMGNEANENNTESDLIQKCCKWLKNVKIADDCKVCTPGSKCSFYENWQKYNIETRKIANNNDAKNATDMQTASTNNDTKKVPTTPTNNNDATKVPTTPTNNDIENYKKLLAEECDKKLFETATAVATIKKAKNGCVIFEMGANTLVLRTNFESSRMNKLEKEYPCNEKLDDDVVDDVEIVPVTGDSICFAYAGFKYNNILYKIQKYMHSTMLSCVMYYENFAANVSKDLTDLVNKTRQEVANLPEIKHCENAAISQKDSVTKISHGPNVLHVYIHGETSRNEIKFQPIVGKCNSKLYLFLKIGQQTYKIEELNEYQAVYLVMEKHVKDGA